MIGQTISHYKILEKLGEGGMGVVYKAEDTKLKRTAALKFLPKELTNDQKANERFQREAQAAAALNHPNIVTIYEINEYEGETYIAMEYIEGWNLREKMSGLAAPRALPEDSGVKGDSPIEETKKIIATAGKSRGEPLEIDEIIDITGQICEGLQKAHDAGIIHRDIKPRNILIDKDGRVKILDFGLAKLKGMSPLTKESATVGTIRYMSPEQTQGGEIDHRTDIWSLGVVLYELITGQLPFKGEYDQAVIYSILNEEPEPLFGLRTGVPLELERIVNKALSKEPSERYQKISELVADLQMFKKESKAAVSTQEKTTAPGIQKKHKIGLVIGAVVIIIVLLLGFWLLSRKQSLPPAEAPGKLKSIAVLPFVNMSADKNQEYFCDGMTEDIITKLSQVTDLKVISRTSVMLYKDRKKRIRDIGEELNAAVILEGSVRKGGDRLRITAQLINAKTEAYIWADAFDRDVDIKDLFKVQSDVALAIVNAMKAELSPGEKEKLKKKPTENLKAYDYYLMGRNYYTRFRKQDNELALELYRKALELDPGYARAYAGLGEVYAQRVFRFGFPPQWLEKAVELSKKAISINPECAEAYKVLGQVYYVRGWLKKAKKATLRSLELNPESTLAQANLLGILILTGEFEEAMIMAKNGLSAAPTEDWYYSTIGFIYNNIGDYHEALVWLRKGLDIQPMSSECNDITILCLLALGRNQQALDQGRKYLSAAPERYSALFYAGYASLFANKFEQAKQYFQKSYEIYSVQSFLYLCNTTLLGYIYWQEGDKDKARKLFDISLDFDRKALAYGVEHFGIPLDLASIHAILGDKGEALKWLQKAVDIGWLDFPGYLVDSLWANLRSEKRFKKMAAEARTRASGIRRRIEEQEAGGGGEQ